MSIAKVDTPFGTVRKLKNGKYRLRKSSRSIESLKNNEEITFHFLIDVGFVITSYEYIMRTEDGIKKIDPSKIEKKGGSLPEYLDAMYDKTLLGEETLYTLIINMVKYQSKS